jgi:spermidine/putrescine transport system substrate-binding protein
MKQDIPVNRRTFLQATGTLGVGSATALAGCIGGSSGSSGNNSSGDAALREKLGLPEFDYEIEDSLNVFQWTSYWPAKTIRNFEKAYGVSVNISNYSSNGEMFSKLKAGGTGQFDVCFPTGNMYPLLISQELIQPLNLKKIPNWDNLGKQWKSEKSYAPGDKRYSMPYMWGTSGVGWRTDMVNGIDTPLSWDVMWDKQYKNQMTMLNSWHETIGASLMRLGYSVNAKDPAKINEAKKECIEQNSLLLAYDSDNTVEHLLNKVASPVHTWNGDVLKVYNQLAKKYKDPPVKFHIPKEGGIKWLDAMAITKNAPHANAAHAFATFLLNGKVAANIAEFNGYATPNEAAEQYLPDKRVHNSIISPSSATKKRLHFASRFPEAPEVKRHYLEAWTEIQNA